MANSRRIASIAIGALAIGGITGGVWATSPVEATSTTQQADGQIPSDGYVAGGKCFRVTVGGLNYETPCSTFHLLPPKVRSCAGTIATGAMLGWVYGSLEAIGEAVKAGAVGGGVSCVPWAN